MRFLIFILLPLLKAEQIPSLYSQEDDVIQLNEFSFNDTDSCSLHHCTAYLVEFYSYWCGSCKAFAPLYKRFAKDVKAWSNVVRVAAVNCGDAANDDICRENGVPYYPYLKYFSRDSRDKVGSHKLSLHQSVSHIRDQLTTLVKDDYTLYRFEDWPQFDYLKSVETYEALWATLPSNSQRMALIVENDQQSLTGLQLLLDLQQYAPSLVARRCLSNHSLINDLHISDFPTLVLYEKGEQTPMLITEIRRLILTEVAKTLNVSTTTQAPEPPTVAENETVVVDCELEPEKCRSMFYVSEVDMLKAMRYALYSETPRTGSPLQGANLSALHDFVGLLADHFPVVTDFPAANAIALDRSTRAVKVFARLRNFIETRGLQSEISVEDWQKQIEEAEESEGHPFPADAEWDHCKGSTADLRGYNCGLWTTFHALTVSAYDKAVNTYRLSEFRPLPVLKAIRDWIANFYGCIFCREHFVQMTTKTLKIQTQVRTPEDVFMYLWRAHNIVNTHLKGRDTEDPQFLKRQFPPSFLCPNCTQNGIPSDVETKRFLTDFYTAIKPFSADKQTTLAEN